LVDERGRDFIFADLGGRLDAWCGQGVRLTPATARELAAALIRFAEHAKHRAGRSIPGTLDSINPTGKEPDA